MSDEKTNRKQGDELRDFLQRIERLTEEKATIGDDIKAVFAEAKGAGFDPAVMRAILKRRAADKEKREQHEAALDLYLHALGEADELPLFAYLKGVDAGSEVGIVEAMGEILPPLGELILKTGKRPLRIWKDELGKVSSEEWTPGTSGRDADGELEPVAPSRKLN
jgi:uncharacterized protein (UPF0335 family)